MCRRATKLFGLGVGLVVLAWAGGNSGHVAGLAQAGKKITVCASGCDFTKIQDAINKATAGDTIKVAEGTYEENLNISVNVTLEGAGAETTTIDGTPGKVQNRPTIFISGKTDVTIRGFAIRNGAIGVRMQQDSRVTLDKNAISGNERGGVVLFDRVQGTLTNNIIADNRDHGILVGHSSRKDETIQVEITSNAIRNNRQCGVVADDDRGITITGRSNTISANAGGQLCGAVNKFPPGFGGESPAKPRERATADRPDDFEGYQIHIMYVLPSDGMDEQLDTNGNLADAVELAQIWFVGQTKGRRLRFDTHQGFLDITFFRLIQTDTLFRSSGVQIRAEIEAELRQAGMFQPKKIYAAYYGGTTDGPCGLGAFPPRVIGEVALIILKGPSCTSKLASQSARGFGMIHEILHTLGFVPPCAPHSDPVGHVTDDPQDIMVPSLSQLFAQFEKPVLDKGRDDYFEHNISGCLDLVKSVFLEPTAEDAVPPPGWR